MTGVTLPGVTFPEGPPLGRARLGQGGGGRCQRERVLCWQPTGPNPLYHRDDLVDRPRAIVQVAVYLTS